MAKRVQIISNTTAATATFIGRASEVTYDSDLAELALHTGAGAGTHKRVPNKDTNDAAYQAKNTLLTALAALVATGGIIAKTGVATVSARTVTGTANEVDVTNGNGSGGNPTLRVSATHVARGSSDLSAGLVKIKQILEVGILSATVATGTVNYDAITQQVLEYTSNASANWVENIRGDSGTTLASLMAVGESITVVHYVKQGGTAYYVTSVQIDGTVTGVTTRWVGGTAPTAGNINSVDKYTFTVTKTAVTPTYTVTASVAKCA